MEGNGKAGVGQNLILLIFIVNENCLMNDGIYIVKGVFFLKVKLEASEVFGPYLCLMINSIAAAVLGIVVLYIWLNLNSFHEIQRHL